MLMEYKEIGDTLTTSELNAIVCLLRHNKVLSEQIYMANGTVTGKYGKYAFNIDSTTITDAGILITDETLTNIGTATLTEPVFSHATYIIHLTVYSFGNINIMADENISNPTVTNLDIELVEDTAVNIPFNTLTNNCIVGFDAQVEIRQDKPVIVMPEE